MAVDTTLAVSSWDPQDSTVAVDTGLAGMLRGPEDFAVAADKNTRCAAHAWLGRVVAVRSHCLYRGRGAYN